MSETPVKIVVNCETGEQEIVPLTAEEIAQRELDAANALAAQEAAEAEAAAIKAAKLSAEQKLADLGLTADEIAALKA